MLLAIAAHEVGDDLIYQRELKFCKDNGRDMSLLEQTSE